MHTGVRNTLGWLIPCRAIIAVWFCAIAVPGPAWASLGGDMESVDADQAAMNATEQITTSTDSYTVYELRTSTGTVVREYLSLDGTVFAVAWQGPVLPNFRQILGDNFTRYTKAAQHRQAGHSHLVIRQSDLVVESSGHMRAFFGRAFLPQMLPQDITKTEIR